MMSHFRHGDVTLLSLHSPPANLPRIGETVLLAGATEGQAAWRVQDIRRTYPVTPFTTALGEQALYRLWGGERIEIVVELVPVDEGGSDGAH